MTTPDPTVTPVAEPETSPKESASQPAEQPQGNVTELLEGIKSEFSARFTELEGKVNAAAGRGSSLAQAQSAIDKTQSSLRNQLARLEQYKKQYNLSDDEAIAEMEADDIEEQWRTKLEKDISDLKSILSNGKGTGAEQNATKVFSDILGEQAMKDARVVDALGKNYGSVAEMQNEAFRLYHQISKLPNPNPAQQASLEGSSVAPNVQKLLDEMEELMTGNDMDAIKAKGDELKQAGAPGWK